MDALELTRGVDLPDRVDLDRDDVALAVPQLEPDDLGHRGVGGDPLPYGIEPNRAVVQELIDHALAQRILTRRPTVEELFAPV